MLQGYVLNIGLNPGLAGMRSAGIPYTLETLQKLGFAYGPFQLKQSSTERTLVIRVIAPVEHVDRWVFELSETLGQDCIAVRSDDGAGALIGPHADSWGEFNPEYFLELEDHAD